MSKKVVKKKKDPTIKDIARSLDKLALAMGKGFSDTHKRFDKVESRLDGVETRLGGVEVRLDGVETRLGTLEYEFKTFKVDVKERLDGHDESIRRLTDTLDKFLKGLTDRDEEMILMKEELKQIKKVLKQKLGVEIGVLK